VTSTLRQVGSRCGAVGRRRVLAVASPRIFKPYNPKGGASQRAAPAHTPANFWGFFPGHLFCRDFFADFFSCQMGATT
jgi:hypothetical protein